MEKPSSLSLEQKFQLQVLETQAKSLSLEQAQQFVVELMRQSMVKDNIMRDWMKQNL